jgi:branched-chain amino acid transport system substrate-binding protein
MIRRSPLARSLVVLGAASLVLAACGGSSSGGSSSAAPSGSDGGSANAGDGTLKVGGLLPQTGSLAFLGPPEFAGVELAVKEINEAGGVLGKPLEWLPGDSGDTSTNVASQTVDRQIAQGVDAIIGAASSSVTLSVIDKVTSSGVVQFSPANTSVVLSTYPDKGLYWRTAPPDTFQGAVLGDLVVQDGNTTAGILALQDAYGEGLANAFEQNFTGAGGSVTEKIIYDPKAASFEAEVSKIKASNPEAVVLIGFDESKKILSEMIKQGIGPDKVSLYLCDGNLSNTLAEGLPKGIMKGTKGTTPGAKADDQFKEALLGVNPKLEDFSYAPESYDAMNLIALAAELGKNDSGEGIAANLVAASSGGEPCTDFATCKAILDGGGDFDYQGRSGPTDFADNGDPQKATMGVYEFSGDNTYAAIDYVTGDVPPATAEEEPSGSPSP